MKSDDVSGFLPPDAVKLLQKAASTPVTPENHLPRTVALEKATAKVKQQYPQFFFKQEK